MNQEENNKFTIIDEFNNEREADLITVLEIEGIEYAVYSLDADSENCDVLVSRIVKHEDGTESLEDIKDEKEREKLHNIVNELMNA